MTTLFERIGGKPAVEAAVDIFYRKVLADDKINHFFTKTNMEDQIIKQKSFLTFAFGGPNNYTGKSLRDGHKHLVEQGLNDSHVDAVIGHLASTLEDLNVEKGDITKIAEIAESVRNDILNK